MDKKNPVKREPRNKTETKEVVSQSFDFKTLEYHKRKEPIMVYDMPKK